ncbi:hypothetical protein BJV78DRAFT_124037 [Lactifluus subvellereus]|nr:hypothetical protein BJV78DRAFT_124037 [Lactifluus subvellereus]
MLGSAITVHIRTPCCAIAFILSCDHPPFAAFLPVLYTQRERDALARPDAPIYHLCSLPGTASNRGARQQAMGQARRPSHKVLALLRATPTSIPASTRQRLSYGKCSFFARCRPPSFRSLLLRRSRFSYFFFSLIDSDCDSREKTVDYRFTNPPRAPSRSSFALPRDIFDADAEIEIVMPSLTEPETPSTAGSTASGRGSTRQRARAMTAFMQDVLNALRSRWHGMQAVRRAEHRIPFDLCD